MCRRIFRNAFCLCFFCICVCNNKLYAQMYTEQQGILPSLLQNGFNFNSILNFPSKNIKGIANYKHKEALNDVIWSVFLNMCSFGFDTYDKKTTLKNCRSILVEMLKLIGWQSFLNSIFTKFINPTNYFTGGICFNKLMFWRVYVTAILEYHYQNYIYVNYYDGKLKDIKVLLMDNKMQIPVEVVSSGGGKNDINSINEINTDIVEKREKDGNIKLNCDDYIPYQDIRRYLNNSKYISLYFSLWQFCIGATFMYKPGVLYLRALYGFVLKFQQVCDFSYYNRDLWYNFVEDSMGNLKDCLNKMFRNTNSMFIDICLGFRYWEVVCSVVIGYFKSNTQSNNVFILANSQIGDNNVNLYKEKPIYTISFYIRRIIYDSCG